MKIVDSDHITSFYRKLLNPPKVNFGNLKLGSLGLGNFGSSGNFIGGMFGGSGNWNRGSEGTSLITESFIAVTTIT